MATNEYVLKINLITLVYRDKILEEILAKMANEEKDILSPELENMLLEFAVHVIEEKPEDLNSFAADYFAERRDRGQSDIEDGSREAIEKALGPGGQGRRQSVMGERYNPEDDDTDEDTEIIPKTDEERQRIKQLTRDVFLFRVLDDTGLGDVIDAMQPTPVEKGQVIIQEGDDGDYFYLIDRGNFDILKKDVTGEDKCIAQIEGKGFFGELALLHNQPRAATVKATTEGFIWRVGRKTFNKLISKRACEKRRMYMTLLSSVTQLESLSEYEIMQIADACSEKSYKVGDVIVNEGDEGDGMYFIIEGKVSVRKKKAAEGATEDEGEAKSGSENEEVAKSGSEDADEKQLGSEDEVQQLGSGDFFGGKY